MEEWVQVGERIQGQEKLVNTGKFVMFYCNYILFCVLFSLLLAMPSVPSFSALHSVFSASSLMFPTPGAQYKRLG